MTPMDSVMVASVVHLTFRYGFNITPQSRLNTPGPVLPTAIVFVAVLNIIYDNRLIPERFDNVSTGLRSTLEVISSIVLMEATMLFWMSVEHCVYLSSKHTLIRMDVVTKSTYHRHEKEIIGAVTYPLSVAILVITSQSTDLHHRLLESFND
ncbi:hypothetical protein KR093_010434 [Drosophila rubida]|uniref:Uncharacterized protein n=1 Tax=Drosophila rubida TaxID=30044 RepID=A0AAD4K8W4_9MUSC|nr:hypothetical protein KR093_010434 [Drosophila rubida]